MGGRPPLITLTTDFGTGSPYVAAMKARLLDGCPEAVIVDVSHSIRAFDVSEGAFVLWAGTRHFAAGAVHLGVVDPGVGGPRRAVAFELAGSRYVGPDNGLFGLVLVETPGPVRAVRLERPADASPTFEGRDVFAPAAAALAAGRRLEELGEPLAGEALSRPAPSMPRVLWVDRFGNLVTSLKPPVAGLEVSGREVRTTARTYAEAPPDEPFLYTGSMGFVEIGIRGGRADERLDARPGTPLRLLRTGP